MRAPRRRSAPCGGTGGLQSACTGAGALRPARERPPDLGLLGAESPGPNSFEVCHALKADPALGIGGVDIITRPRTAEQVLARVRARLPGGTRARRSRRWASWRGSRPMSAWRR